MIGKFDYYVIFDDDLKLDFSIEYFESLVSQYHPARLTPNMPNNFYTHEPAGSIVTALKYVDHCLMALCVEAADKLMPYSTEFDQTCWWKGSEEFCERCWDNFRWQTLKLNQMSVMNLQNRAYPKEYRSELPENEFTVI